ncbi:tRNA (uridine(54)-C5)-methyltransferase TrmA [Vibrio ulleungensis]|uniref:tRNA/tmRNA (uracil-C(5))-methyltransferase n=1 Tax=Vibrio ulleungensis TaxID=2807619 RepID=A0ABS2HME6_9VIBR|nr:tRNA (uridine(54)-C5)-methyltransferase TrmA [Vibrio ulleungensis]MBM7038665.1 tRNA (uridine(54)-C5)-methyltransferase TrmA [Vibrio ulleungensis]
MSMYDSHSYQVQLTDKIQRLESDFAKFEPPVLDVYASEEQHYRMRAEFRVWHEGDDLYYIMFDQQTREKYRVDQFPTASALINKMMPTLLDSIKDNQLLRTKLFQVDFLSTLSGELLVSMLYHKAIDDEWVQQAKQLREQFIEQGYNVNLIGRARKIKHIIEKDYVIEKLHVDGQELVYQQVENSFTQPNGKVAEKMLEWAIDCTKNSNGDLLELYCGNGNFSLALAKNFRRVLATELAKPSVDSAQFNIAANNIDNVKIIRMSAEDFTLAMNGERTFRRLQQAQVELSDYECNTIFVDPPRSGMDDETCKMVQGYDNIMYISCNPDTLKDNLEILCTTHRITRFALFDQFPYTHHVEAGVFLERIK